MFGIMGCNAVFANAAKARSKKQAGNYITLKSSEENPTIWRLSGNGLVVVESTKQGQSVKDTYTNPSDLAIDIQADAYMDITIKGDVTKIILFEFYQGSPKGCKDIINIDVTHDMLLEQLKVSNNTGITELDLSANTALTSLSCDSTGITELDLSANTALTSLSCSSTGITELDLSANTALTSLSCSSTGITELDLSANTALTNLSCGSTGITELDLSANTALTSLSCDRTGLTSLDLTQLTDLEYFNCAITSISELNFSNCDQIMQANLQGCASLNSLYYNASNQNVSNSIAQAITAADAADGTVYTDSAGAYYSTIADAATAKGWTIEQLS